MEFSILGIGGAVLVALLVEGAKKLFPSLAEDDRKIVGLALALGVLLSVLSYLGQIIPGVETWLEVILSGLIAGFVAMGMYDTQKIARS